MAGMIVGAVTWALSCRPARWVWARHRREVGRVAKGHRPRSGDRELFRHMLVHALHGEQWTRTRWRYADEMWWVCQCEAPRPAGEIVV